MHTFLITKKKLSVQVQVHENFQTCRWYADIKRLRTAGITDTTSVDRNVKKKYITYLDTHNLDTQI